MSPTFCIGGASSRSKRWIAFWRRSEWQRPIFFPQRIERVLGLTPRGGIAVPVVSHAVALFEPLIRAAAIQALLHLPESALQSVHTRTSGARRKWERFVAIRVSPSDASQMDPLVLPEAIALIDRHYNSLLPYRPHRQNLYAVHQGSRLTLRYVEFASSRLVLRPYINAFPVHLIEVGPEESPENLLVGRIALILNEL